ncbi:MAG: elongation factor G [Phycisphaerae bacterium]|nr:elongation factor G [Phycisphaerae bacterium]
MAKNLQQLRNIGIIAHIDAGKTTVSERILYFAGRTHKIGEVHDGTAVMDYLEEEQQRGITITSAATTLLWGDCQVNLIDTPGHVDFTIEVERSLRVLDGAVVVFDSVSGVEAQTETVWRQADRYHVPRLCFINKLDRIGADFAGSVASIQQRLHARPVLLQIPMGESETFAGQIDLITRRAFFYEHADVGTTMREEAIPAEYADAAEIARHDLLDAVAEFDDAMMEKYLADQHEAITADDIRRAVRNGTCTNAIQPVLCGSALKSMGIPKLLDAVVAYLPSPLEIPPVTGHESLRGTKELTRRPDASEPFAALVFKILSDQHGDLHFIRIYSGTLSSGARVLNSTQDKKENIARVWRMHAKTREKIDEAVAGEIVAVVGAKDSITGDTLCDTKHPIVLERLEFVEPVIAMSIEPRTNADKNALMHALETLRREDPSFRFRFDGETGQTVISGMGELHLEIIKNKLVRDMHLDVRVGKPKVSYKETVLGQARVEHEFIRQLGGRGQFAVVTLNVEAHTPQEGADAAETIVFRNELKSGVLSREYIAAVEQGVRDAATSGPLAGYPMLNVKVTLVDARSHPADSTDLAFQQAAALAFNEAVQKANPVFLEPIMRLTVTTPDPYLGSVTGDLNARRAEITEMETRGEIRVLHAHAPLAEMFGYSTQLRSISAGRAQYTMEPHSYAPAPQSVTDSILKYV